MLKLVLLIFYVGVTNVLCFRPNCVKENQHKYYAFSVEACSLYFRELCIPVSSGRFETIGHPTIVKIGVNTILPTCAFYNIDSLEYIYGVKSEIKVLAKGAFINLPSLRSIDLSNNKITEVHDKIFQNVFVEKLNLSWNSILFIDPDAFKEVHNLKELDISWNSLVTVPINQLSTSISSLNLAHNQLTRIAINSRGFKNLTNVDLSHNKIERIAISFDYQIDIFDLTNNELSDIDYAEISSVSTFRIGSNRFRTVPIYLEDINAKYLNIYPNPWNCEALNKLWFYMRSLNYDIETMEKLVVCNENNVTGMFLRENLQFLSCNNNGECPIHHVCKSGQCLDPCQFFCHETSVCEFNNREFRCTCPEGTKTNPMDLTGSCNKVECYVSMDCTMSKECIENSCMIVKSTGLTFYPTDESDPFMYPPKLWWLEEIPNPLMKLEEKLLPDVVIAIN
ncbi:hypothetical protein GWI33_007871 [Rhynchophorus ferrugineus]|uniref:Uncharacterized protein n=1 Tax=Rhynchophorus ferrugineus TaxID=354439 RepID=A0A834IS32_RHYFE|nr:hypothetical protein GWI33_007871 [Rhynchophorus ferrugineus]